MCFSTAILSYNIMRCSFHPMTDNEVLYDSSRVPSWKHRWMASVLSLTGLLKHLFRLVGPFFVVLKVRAWLHDCCSSKSHIQGLRWRHGWSGRTLLDSARISFFFHSCNRLIIPNSQLVLQSRHGWLWEFSQNSKILLLSRSAIKSCDSLLNLLIFCVWLKSWTNDSWCLWFSNFSINLLTLFSRVVFCCSTAERGAPDILWSTVLLQISS